MSADAQSPDDVCMKESLTIIIVEPNRDRALQIVDALKRVSASNEVHVVADAGALKQQVEALMPDVVLIDVADPSRDVLEELAMALGPTERPVAMFVDQSNDGLTAMAIEAGCGGWAQHRRLKPIMEAAIARFRMMQRMRKELSEDEAYALLRKAAMDQNRRVADVAEALVSTAGFLS